MTTVKIKSGDTARVFTSNLQTDGVDVDLTGASVLMLLKMKDSPYTAYSLTASVVGTATEGNVSCTQDGSFPTAAGEYNQEWEVTFSGGTKLTFPSNSYNTINILDDLN